ncbi:DUF2861 family protein [Aliivibrio fischeri]|nr:DUF2861 family protein [Aliivibrio fischeri]MBP3154704.1 DUF2861 family protein [Aliivibrio fischeri]
MMFMRKFFVFCSLVCASYTSFANSVDWFNEQSALYTAHKQFLEGHARKGFATSIEVLQNSANENITNNIDKLLSSAISVNCGRDLSNKVIPNWLKSVSVQRVIIQSSGRLHHRLIVKFDTKKPISSLSFIKWPQEEQLTNPSIKTTPTQDERITQYTYASESLNNRIQNGLYKLIIIADDKEKTQWESWVVLTTPKTEMQVAWLGKDKWKTTQTGLLKSNCPLPEMAVGIYDHQDNEYIKLWEQTYEEKFPKSLPSTNVLPGSYILSVSFNHKRFQGPISIQEIQAITKVMNFGSDENTESK